MVRRGFGRGGCGSGILDGVQSGWVGLLLVVGSAVLSRSQR
jgi:hypothetical protein